MKWGVCLKDFAYLPCVSSRWEHAYNILICSWTSWISLGLATRCRIEPLSISFVIHPSSVLISLQMAVEAVVVKAKIFARVFSCIIANRERSIASGTKACIHSIRIMTITFWCNRNRVWHKDLLFHCLTTQSFEGTCLPILERHIGGLQHVKCQYFFPSITFFERVGKQEKQNPHPRRSSAVRARAHHF